MGRGQDADDPLDYHDLYRDAVRAASNESILVEVGTFVGRSAIKMATMIAESEKSIAFFAIDTWCGSCGTDPVQDNHLDRYLGGGLESGKAWDMFVENVRQWNVSHLIHPLRMLSVIAAQQFADQSIDFVFIDASHTYAGVMCDIYAWYPKVRGGGIIAGHDYIRGWDGVIKAVDEFFGPRAIEIHPPQSWLFRKPADAAYQPQGYARRAVEPLVLSSGDTSNEQYPARKPVILPRGW